MFAFTMMFLQKFQRVKTLKTNKIKQMNGHKKNKVCRRLCFLLKPVLGLNLSNKYLKYNIPLSQRWILIFYFLFCFYAATPQYNTTKLTVILFL